MASASFVDLGPDEHELVASTGQDAAGGFTDPIDERIFWLVSRRLTLVGTADGGWVQRYRDPRDDRVWELTFPRGSLHGGGPRRLVLVPPPAATPHGERR
jgi:hypothetical protein